MGKAEIMGQFDNIWYGDNLELFRVKLPKKQNNSVDDIAPIYSIIT